MLTPEQLRRLNRLLDDIEEGRLEETGERQLRGLLARIDSSALVMDLATLYEFGGMAAGFLRLLENPKARTALAEA